MKKDRREINILRSSAAEYLTFVASTGADEKSIEMRYEDENIWLTQKMMATLYDVDVRTINDHIKKIYSDSELEQSATIRKYRIVQTEGSRVHGQTAAEVVYNRANVEKEHMGLTTWDGSPKSKIHAYDVVVAKNYLTEKELFQLGRLVSSYLDFAEAQAERHIPMTMADWEERLNGFLKVWDRDVLQDAGKISAELAKSHALNEFEKYRIVQDRLYQSDFDRILLEDASQGLPETIAKETGKDDGDK